MNINKNNKLLTKTKIAGFVLKPNCIDIKEKYLHIKNIFKKYQIDVLLDKQSANELSILGGVDFDTLCIKSDFLVTLGGDGTLISVARRGFGYQKAVMGINLGTLGFLTDIMPDEIEDFLENFLAKKYRIDHRMMIKAIIDNKEIVAFNDIVLSRDNLTTMIKLDAKIDNKLFNKYNGDGVIISTPTGSTAYNLSCNGPVVYPLTDAFIVTPISAHSLTQRPLVLPADFTICFQNKNKEKIAMIVDGHDIYDLLPNQEVVIQIASLKAKLIHRYERNYFDLLNKKLHWGAN
jgi:NAD+ kinase